MKDEPRFAVGDRVKYLLDYMDDPYRACVGEVVRVDLDDGDYWYSITVDGHPKIDSFMVKESEIIEKLN